jgi:hypothetical protein
MKKNHAWIFVAMTTILIMYSCANDENYYLKDIKSNERSILAVKVPKQIGNAEIVTDGTDRKITIFVQPGANLTSVKPDIQVSSKAKISPSLDEPFNFTANNNQRTYTVTSETGKTQDWVIEIKEYDFDMDGTWKINAVQFYYNVSVLYGADDWKGTKDLQNPLPGVAAETDNLITFTLEGATDDGNLFGTFTNAAGADGNYPTFVWSGNNTTDFSYKFDKVPAVSGTWFRNLTDNTITFNKGKADQSVSMALEWQNDKQTLVIPFNPGPKDIVWDNDWGRMELQCTEKFWVTLTK